MTACLAFDQRIHEGCLQSIVSPGHHKGRTRMKSDFEQLKRHGGGGSEERAVSSNARLARLH